MDAVTRSQLANKLALAVLAVLLAVLFLSPLHWLIRSLTASEYRLHSVLLVGFVVFLVSRNRHLIIGSNFEVRALPLIVFLVGIFGFLLSRGLLEMDVISCLFFGVTIYGFIGFLIGSEKWKDSFVMVLLFFACLPLSYHIETFLGFPLRLFSAKTVGAFFSLVSQNVHSTETILMVDNKLAHIDLPCSGLKSLWSISLFILLLSIIERFRVSLSWTAAFALAFCLTIAANMFRIIVLVLIYGSELPEELKDSLHVPVGLLGFIVTCMMTYWLFHKMARDRTASAERVQCQFSYKGVGVIAAILALAISLQQRLRLETIATAPAPAMSETKGSLALTEKERDLFLRHGVLSYHKTRFDIEGIRGTAFLVLSKSWRAHHHPEQCLQGQGHRILSSRTLVIGNDLQVRSVALKDSENQVAYWFQGKEDSTDDYSSRVWSGVVHPARPYVMVSLYLENVKLTGPVAFESLIKGFRSQAMAMFENEALGEKQN